MCAAAVGWVLVLALASLGLAGESAPGRVLVGQSGLQVEDDLGQARQAAEEAAQADLLRQLGRLAGDLTGRSLSQQACWREYLWLVKQRGVSKDYEESREVKSYGAVVRATYRVTVPEDTLELWRQRLEVAHRTWLRQCLMGVMATFAGWLGGMLLLIGLDRWTLGYRRGFILSLGLLVGIALTAAGWFWILYIRY